MANSYVTYIGNGVQTDYTVTFPYIARQHVKVYVNDVLTSAFIWLNDSIIRLDTAPASGVIVLIRRITPTEEKMVDFSKGARLGETDLDLITDQLTYALQEAVEGFGGEIEEHIGVFADMDQVRADMTAIQAEVGQLEAEVIQTNRDLTDLNTDLTTEIQRYAGFRNRIINGDMRLDQRYSGTSFDVTKGASYQMCVDRWFVFGSGATTTGQRVAGSGDSQYRLQLFGSEGVTALGIGQRIEAAHCRDLAGKTVVLSVDIANSLLTSVDWLVSYANTENNWGTRSVPRKVQIATGTFTVSPTITRYSATFTVPAEATTGIEVIFSVGAQVSGTWTIGDVQLEIGSVATPFERRAYAIENMLCRRYYNKFDTYGAGLCVSTTQGSVAVQFPVMAKATPIITFSGGTLQCGGTSVAISGFSYDTLNGGCVVNCSVGSAVLAVGQACLASFSIRIDSELLLVS